MKNLNWILIVGFFALSCAIAFMMSYGFRMFKMKCFLEPELTAATLFLICFAVLIGVNERLKPKKTTLPDNQLVPNNIKTPSPDVETPPANLENTQITEELALAKKRINDLEAIAEQEQKSFKAEQSAWKKEKEEIQKAHDTFKNERDINEKYFICLNKRYDDLLEIARIADENDPVAMTRLWQILISLGLHQYDYMKKICDDDNWRSEQAANIRLVLDEIKVGALKKEEYKIYTDDARYMATHFRVLRRRLRELGIEQLDDVLISGVRI